MARPAIYVLAGVNGAGKSSIGGQALTDAGMTWFNPDTFARALVKDFRYSQNEANIAAWGAGVKNLDEAVAAGHSYAFETTLGGNTIVRKLIEASTTHDIVVWFCSLSNANQHIARVRQRVSQGGHDIPESKIRERCRTSMANMLTLLPYASEARAYDNSVDVEIGAPVPEPRLVLHVVAGECKFPLSNADIHRTPEWAKPLVELAMSPQP